MAQSKNEIKDFLLDMHREMKRMHQQTVEQEKERIQMQEVRDPENSEAKNKSYWEKVEKEAYRIINDEAGYAGPKF